MTAAPVGRVVVVLGALRGGGHRDRGPPRRGARAPASAGTRARRPRSRAGSPELADCEAVVVTLGDQPRMSPDAIRRVIGARDGEAAAVRATYVGEPGHPVLLERELFESFRERDRRPRRAQPPAQRAGPRGAVRRPRRWRGRGHARRARRAARRRPGHGRADAVKLEQSFEVRAPLERVWETLIDVERVAPCLPGCRDHRGGRGRHLPRHLQRPARPDHAPPIVAS